MNDILISWSGWYNNNAFSWLFDNSVLNCHATVSWKRQQSAWQSGAGWNDNNHNSITVGHIHVTQTTYYSVRYNLDDDHDEGCTFVADSHIMHYDV